MSDELINELYSIVRKYCWEHRCYNEDLVQELVTYVFEKLDKFDTKRGKFSTYVYKLCHNKQLMLLREQNTMRSKSNFNTVSLNEIIDEEDSERVDLLIDTSDNSVYYKKAVVDYVYPRLSDIAKKYFDGVNQVDLAKEYNISQANISRKIKKEIADIKKKLELEEK